jgi:protein-S-isoprenylcysteine O-methyltransferase Ste14
MEGFPITPEYNACSLFYEPSSKIDYFLALTLIQFMIFRFYYTFRFPYGTLELLVRKIPLLNSFAYKSEAKKNEDMKPHKEKFVEPYWLVRYVMSAGLLSMFVSFLYFRMDRFYIVQHTPLNYIAPYLAQLSRVVICSGDITFIPRDSTIGTIIRIMGLIILQYSNLFMTRVQYEMQASWTPVIHLKKDHKLITSGPFQIVRHPMYFSFFQMAIGLSLASLNWILTLTTFLNFFGTLLRIPIEEKLLSETYGEEYEKYRATVKYAIIPSIY